MTSNDRFDVAVIGAGINGAGIARDAALRGLKVLVLDKDDVCSGTSAISSRLIHGGLRYLEHGEIPLVYESLRERRILQRVAPHLVTPIRITIPIFSGARRGRLLIRLGMWLYDLLSFRKSLPGHDMLDREEAIAAATGLQREGLLGMARYFDAQITYTERLVVENLLAAKAAGAVVVNHTEVTSFDCGDDNTKTLHASRPDGEVVTFSASVVINAAGPWVDKVLRTAVPEARRLVGGTKGSHMIVGNFAGAPDDAFYVEAEADGRPFFVIPWNGLYLIGTTDIRYEGSLDHIRADMKEIDYLLSETNRVFPNAKLSVAKVHYAYAGVRPLPHREKGPESAITRKHIIKINKEVARGIVSIIGGKITTYRSLAKQTVDRVASLLDRRLPSCRTADVPLPGASGIENARRRLADIPVLADVDVDRLLRIYGGRAGAIANLAQHASLAEPIDAGCGVLAAEVVFVIREEFALTLTDIVFRRMMLGLDADQGRGLYAPIAEVAADELSWDEGEKRNQLQALLKYADSLLVH